jgi:hypothetical protein
MYFEQASRGFGERAFHVMWWLLFQELRPRRFLEIGVYRGQTLSLAAMLHRTLGVDGGVVGVSPFSAAARDSLCTYRDDVDYLEDTLGNFRHFDLPAPALVTAYSTDEEATAVIRAGGWDCVYVDGNHDYDIVREDWENAAHGVVEGGVIVLDDAGSTTSFRAPAFATAGLPGPSRVAAEVGGSAFVEILQVGHNRVFQRRG